MTVVDVSPFPLDLWRDTEPPNPQSPSGFCFRHLFLHVTALERLNGFFYEKQSELIVEKLSCRHFVARAPGPLALVTNGIEKN